MYKLSRFLLALALLSMHGHVADAAQIHSPANVTWTAGQPAIDLNESSLAQLGRDGLSLRVRFQLPPNGTNRNLLQWQSLNRRSGFRLFATAEPGWELHFEMAFDWANPRNNRSLQLSAPGSIVGDGQTHEATVRFTGPHLELYIDGVLVDEEWPVGGLAHATGQPFLVDPEGSLQSVWVWDRALDKEEILEMSGGPSAVTAREEKLFGPEKAVTSYWKPPGFNTWVGDCMPFFHEGRFHLFYLIDRHGHASKWGLGAHQWAHVSTSDLLHWDFHPLAIGITDEAEGSICTGSALAFEDAIYGFFAVRTCDGSPARLTSARATDGVHFEKSDWSISLRPPYSGPPARDPMIFRDPVTNIFHMLVTTELSGATIGSMPPVNVLAKRGGCLAHLTSKDLVTWDQQPPYLVPGFTDQPECSDWFEWNGWYYLIFSNNGVARYRISRGPHGPWLKPRVDVFDGPQARVLKTAAFTGNRRLGAAFLTQSSAGYAGHLVMRELLQHEDGSLGTTFVKEMEPASLATVPLGIQQLAGTVTGSPTRVLVESFSGLAIGAIDHIPRNFRLKLRVKPEPKTSAFGLCVRGSGLYEKGHELRLEPSREKVGWRHLDSDTIEENGRAAIYNVGRLEMGLDLEVIAKDDILDVCVDGRRTLINRAKPSFNGDRLFLFAQNGSATFEHIEVEPLMDSR